MSTENLLVELLVEELPPKALQKLGEAFATTLYNYLESNWFTWKPDTIASDLNAEDPPNYDVFSTPRRLAVLIRAVLPNAPDMNQSIKLMPVSVGLDANGNATPALNKRLQSLGLTEAAVSQLTKQMDGKNEVLFIEVRQTGATLLEGLQKALDEALAKLPIPKVMSYQLADGWETVNFVRPAHGLMALHGSDIVPVTALGLASGNVTQGHRFEAEKPTITIKNADTYADQLKKGAVIASFEDRRREIAQQLLTAAKKNDCRLDCQPDLFGHEEETTFLTIEDDSLINEVTALVERPNILLGQFDESFLEVPAECLSLTMKTNQKYFPLYEDVSGRKGKLTNKFLIVSNISPADPSAVIQGNERVIRPRLADAKFFFDQDRKKTLESRLEGLGKVVYHNQLGSQADRANRVNQIAIDISAILLKADISFTKTISEAAQLAARLSKADLLTDMVGEFPELQGIMGRYYAQNENLDNDVAFAIEDHYKPRFAGDELPRNSTGLIVALADKLETLIGMFRIGNLPTGDKDPFALRRHSLGVIRILMETKLPINLNVLLTQAHNSWLISSGLPTTGVEENLPKFFEERLSTLLKDKNASSQEVDAVLSLNPQMLYKIPELLTAVQVFSSLPEAPALAAANKRVGNILKKVEGEVKTEINADLLKEPAEIALNTALSKVKPQADKLFESGDYTASLQALAALKAPVDDFFDNVMVNADDPALKANRLGLLATLHQTMNRVADLSKLAS